ncbi:AAA domain-containing protein [Trametes maxima]|nr:AAA domain-containing protein [Trametes maxima]
MSTSAPVTSLSTSTAGFPKRLLPEGQRIVLILAGLIGSGKSTFAQALEQYFPEVRRCSQDELGDRRSVESLARRSLQDGMSVCIDRTNFDESQRAIWINIAREFPRVQPWVIVFDTPYEICTARIKERTGHPTITSPELGIQVLERFRSQYRPPAPHEGYTRILRLRPADCPDSGYSEADVRHVMRRLRESQEVPHAVRPYGAHFHGGGLQRGGGSQHGGGVQRGSYHRGSSNQQQGFYPRGGLSYRGGSYARGGYLGDNMRQTTLPWARRGGEASGTSSGSGYMHASDVRRSGYDQPQEGPRPGYDRTQEGSWRR